MSAPAALCPTDLPVPAARAAIAPLPPAMWMRTRSALQSPIFWRWVVLSILLHVLAILLFGSPVGGQKEGRAMFGRLSVVIKEGWRDTGPDLKMERELAPKPADAPSPRSSPKGEGAARKAPPPPVDLGVSKEIKPRTQDPLPDPLPREREVAPPPVPQMLERLQPSEPKMELAPAPKIPPPVEAPPAPVTPPAIMERITAPKVERTLVEPPPLPAPVPAPAPPQLLERMPAPRVERQLMEAPPTPPATLERLPAPRIERQLLEAPPTPPATLERLPAPRIERQLMETPPLPAPAPVAPAPAAAPVAPVAPAPSAPVREAAPVPRDPLPSPLPRERETSTTAPRERETSTTAPRERETSPTAPRERETSPTAPREREGLRPAPGDSPFRRDPLPREREPTSNYDPTAAPPALDIDMMRKRAGELGRAGTGNRAALPFPMPPVPEKKNKLEEAIEKARKPDCREAYKHFGLAAVVPLIANEFGEGKCKW